MKYPLSLRFKLIALASQIYVDDADGNPVCYVKQKMFKLKESVNVFTNSEQQNLLCKIDADRIIDFSACYRFTDQSGAEFGAVRRKGMKSLWKAHYDVIDGEDHLLTIQEENAWVKVVDGMLGEVPVLGMFTGYFFNPTYIIGATDGTPMMRLKKKPAMFEGKYELDKLAEMDGVEELRAIMSVLMMTLLERGRG